MNTIINMLMTKERKESTVLQNTSNLLQRNIELIYKNDPFLASESITNVLSVSSIEKIKSLYHTPLHKSEFTVDVFNKLKKDISEQTVVPEQSNPNIMFHSFALKITNYFEKTQYNKFHKYNDLLEYPEQCKKSILEQLEKMVLKLSYRTLVMDMNISREKGLLLGESTEQQYEYYNRSCLQRDSYIKSLFDNYPVLLRTIGNEIRKYKKLINEILSRFKKDYIQLINVFDFKANHLKIRTIEMGMGDAHSDGRKVTQLILNQGKLIYKPRSLATDELYKEIINFLNNNQSQSRFHLKAPKVLSRINYGWAEYITFKECEDIKDIKTFYERTGAQIALLYTLQAVDFHSENLIAHGDSPVLIDLESLFHPFYEREEVKETSAYMQAEKQLQESVRALGLLPFFFGGKSDISGIGRKGKAKSLIKIPQLKDLKTAKMSVKREYMDVGDSYNYPQINDHFINARDYVKELKIGFENMYSCIQSHAEDLITLIEKYEKKVYVRFIPKPTVKYATLLELSFHPRFLHNSIDREVFISKIWQDSKSEYEYTRLIKHEFDDLFNNDIPYFKVKLDSKDLLTSKSKLIQNYFTETPVNKVKNRIRDLNKEDLEFQLQVIELSMLASEDDRQIVLKEFVSKKQKDYLTPFNWTERDTIIERAEELALYIKNKSYEAETTRRKTYSWLNTTPIGVEEVQWNLSVMGDTFYDGLSGMALTYLALWKVTKKKEYLQQAEDMMNDVASRFTNITIDPQNNHYMSIGAYSGVSSIIYALMNFYTITQNKHFEDQAKQVSQLIPKLLPYDKELDIIGGSAGAVAVLIRAYEVDQDPLFLSLAEQCGNYLIEQSITINDEQITWEGVAQKPLTGFSHGNAGIIYALHLLNKYSENSNLKVYIQKGLQFENEHITNNNWNDLRKPIKEAASSAWCHGSPGILLSRLELSSSEYSQIKVKAENDIEMALPNILHDGFGREQSLCHGDIGNAMILMQYGKKKNQSDWIDIGRHLIWESVQAKQLGNYQCGVGANIETPNLMLGLAGIVYGLLYALDTDLPNILDIEIAHFKKQ